MSNVVRLLPMPTGLIMHTHLNIHPNDADFPPWWRIREQAVVKTWTHFDGVERAVVRRSYRRFGQHEVVVGRLSGVTPSVEVPNGERVHGAVDVCSRPHRDQFEAISSIGEGKPDQGARGEQLLRLKIRPCTRRQALHEETGLVRGDRPCTRRQALHDETGLVRGDRPCTRRQALYEETGLVRGDRPCTRRQALYEETGLVRGDRPCTRRQALYEETGLVRGDRPCTRRQALHEETGLARGDRPCTRRQALYEETGLARGDRPCHLFWWMPSYDRRKVLFASCRRWVFHQALERKNQRHNTRRQRWYRDAHGRSVYQSWCTEHTVVLPSLLLGFCRCWHLFDVGASKLSRNISILTGCVEAPEGHRFSMVAFTAHWRRTSWLPCLKNTWKLLESLATNVTTPNVCRSRDSPSSSTKVNSPSRIIRRSNCSPCALPPSWVSLQQYRWRLRADPCAACYRHQRWILLGVFSHLRKVEKLEDTK